jgi:hypothetical protein
VQYRTPASSHPHSPASLIITGAITIIGAIIASLASLTFLINGIALQLLLLHDAHSKLVNAGAGVVDSVELLVEADPV